MKNQKNRKHRIIYSVLSIILCICIIIGSIQLTAYGQDEPETTAEAIVETDLPEEEPAEEKNTEEESIEEKTTEEESTVEEPKKEESDIEESITEQISDVETPTTEIESDTETNTSIQTETETETDISTETDLEITTVIESSDTEEIDEAVVYVQALIDALPSPDDITAENADEITEKITEIDAAIGQLTDEQAAKLNKDAYFDVSEKLVEINRGGGKA